MRNHLHYALWEGHMKILIQLIVLLFVFGSHMVLARGDVEAGKTKSAPCAACHGVDGNSANPEWPKLAGQGAPYIFAQLRLFKNGERKNALMSPMAAALSEQDMHDLAAYYESQTTTPEAADPDVVELGEAIYRGGIIEKGVAACTGCHSPTGAGNPAAKFPKLSGQHAKYTEIQLKAYRAEDLHGHQEGQRETANAKIMVKVAERLTDEEIRAVAQYTAGLH